MLALAGLSAVADVKAVEISTDNTDLSIRWDNTVKYSAGFRVKNRSDTLVADPNQDDGDRNFKWGLVSNRLDLLSEFDLTCKNDLGFRTSGAGWYDTVPPIQRQRLARDPCSRLSPRTTPGRASQCSAWAWPLRASAGAQRRCAGMHP